MLFTSTYHFFGFSSETQVCVCGYFEKNPRIVNNNAAKRERAKADHVTEQSGCTISTVRSKTGW